MKNLVEKLGPPPLDNVFRKIWVEKLAPPPLDNVFRKIWKPEESCSSCPSDQAVPSAVLDVSMALSEDDDGEEEQAFNVGGEDEEPEMKVDNHNDCDRERETKVFCRVMCNLLQKEEKSQHELVKEQEHDRAKSTAALNEGKVFLDTENDERSEKVLDNEERQAQIMARIATNLRQKKVCKPPAQKEPAGIDDEPQFLDAVEERELSEEELSIYFCPSTLALADESLISEDQEGEIVFRSFDEDTEGVQKQGISVADELPLFPDEGALVGTPALLGSANVQEAVMGEIVRPSVFSDARGSIHNVQVGAQPLNLLFTRALVMRSGDIHRVAQYDFVVSGAVRVWTLRTDGSTHKLEYGPRDLIEIAPYTPHIFEFLQDTVLMEWWDGEFAAWYYKPYRALVERSFCKTARSVPEMVYPVESSQLRIRTIIHNLAKVKILLALKEKVRALRAAELQAAVQENKWWCAGMLLSLSTGFMLGRRANPRRHAAYK